MAQANDCSLPCPPTRFFSMGPPGLPMARRSPSPTLGVGEAVSWGLNVINVADGSVRRLVSSGGRYVGRAVWTPDGDALVATLGETTLGRGQLQSIEYPSGKMHRFSNDLADYAPAVDLTRAGNMLAAIQRTQGFRHLDCASGGYHPSAPAYFRRIRLFNRRPWPIRKTPRGER